ncbi:ABC transporter substrate-binding protein [Pikeienuella sp. HZG-20]|uniref:ABC transporter substrate-binding protein n=1 Tax=Paludibacillus litoralis TaxID=3133267 RepID=UPI0030EC7D65
MKLSRFIGGLAMAASVAFAPSGQAEETAGGTLIIVSTQVPRHLNGAVQSGTATAVPSTQIFASLLRYDDEWNPEPYLAKSWEVSDDGLSATFHLVEGATFHDGEPITSEDVAFSIMTIKENHPFKTMFAPVEAVETPDPLTAVFRLSQPHPALLLALSPALAPIIPKHVFDDGQDMKSHPMNQMPVGSGPFMVKEFTASEAVILEKNPNFFRKGYPKLDEIIIRIIKDPSAVLIAMENGEADMFPFVSSSTGIRRMKEAERIAVTDRGYEGIGPINWLAFNTRKEKLSDPRVRQAIGYAVDREFITKALMRGYAKTQSSPIVESSPFFDPMIPRYDVDLDKAKALLAEAGYGDGFELMVDYLPGVDEQQKNIAEYLKSQLKKVGIDVTVRASPDFPTWAKHLSNDDFEMSMDAVFNWGDPVIGVHRTYLSTNIVPGVIWSNTQGYKNLKVDEILDAAAVEMDLEKRKALYAEFQRIVAEDLPIYWINLLPYHTAYDDRLGNPPMTIWGPMSPLDEVYWKEPKE